MAGRAFGPSCIDIRRYVLMARYKYGKTFRCKKGKYKGKLVNYRYTNGRKSSKRLVLDKSRRRY